MGVVDLLESAALRIKSMRHFLSFPELFWLYSKRAVFLDGRIMIIPVFLISLIYSAHSYGADPDSSGSPPPFGPNDMQHGFSEYDTMPSIPSDSPADSQSQILPKSSQNLDQPPEGLFYTIEFAEGFEEEEGLRRGHILSPIHPTDVFRPDTRAIFLVFSVFKHYAPYQVFGRMYPEHVDGLDPHHLLDEDTIFLATEDESGYLQFFPPTGKWQSGAYRVEIYVGYEINPVNRMGTMRFSVTNDSKAAISP